MIDEKVIQPSQGSSRGPPEAPPPAYGQPPNDKGSPSSAAPPPQAYGAQPSQQYPAQPYYSPQGAGTPGAPIYPQYTGGSPPGYPPQPGPPQAPLLSAGAQYQQQLFAMCAAGNHDIQSKHGIAGIIGAIVFFPIGLLCLMADTEKRMKTCSVSADLATHESTMGQDEGARIKFSHGKWESLVCGAGALMHPRNAG
ncbi:hypothetical protein BC628DRAFT_1338725 [Trametes gibbosa]|nr:hypothetical protein BC628DRAFT_1338725 [Trametes gibbosa]